MIHTTIEAAPKKPAYPYIGEYKASHAHFFVLFTAKGEGTLLKDADSYTAGYSKGSWAEEMYTPLKGSITLSNKD